MKSIQHYVCSVLQKIEEWKYRNVKCNSFVLMFHETPYQISDTNDESITISYDSFVKLINLLQKKGYVFSDISHIRDCTKKKTIYITFDDIFMSAYQNAITYLTKEKIPFTCFIAPQLMGKEGFISNKELIDLGNNPFCTIGAHSNEHIRLRDLSNKQILEDFKLSKAILENSIKKSVDIMAYPFGSRSACPPRVKKLAEDAGFSIAFSTYHIPAIGEYIQRNSFFIPRINVIESNFESTLSYMGERSNAKG